MHASLSGHEGLDSAGVCAMVAEVVGGGGSGHRFRAEIWVREEDATRARLHDSLAHVVAGPRESTSASDYCRSNLGLFQLDSKY